jgi:hypothetical protein
MPEQKRERIGDFVITGPENLDANHVICAKCGKKLAQLDHEQGHIVPTCEELVEGGSVAWPNFGWFCSPECEALYVKQYGVRLERVAKAKPLVTSAHPQRRWWNWFLRK